MNLVKERLLSHEFLFLGCFLDLVLGLGPWTWSLDLVLGLGPWTWSLDLVLGLGPWTCSLDLLLGLAPWTCSLDLLLGLAPWTCSLDLLLGLAPWTPCTKLLDSDTGLGILDSGSSFVVFPLLSIPTLPSAKKGREEKQIYGIYFRQTEQFVTLFCNFFPHFFSASFFGKPCGREKKHFSAKDEFLFLLFSNLNLNKAFFKKYYKHEIEQVFL
jgi:hypothetical protein